MSEEERGKPVKGYKVTEHYSNGESLVWTKETDAIGVVASFATLDNIIKDGQSARFHLNLPFTTSITIEVIR